MSERPAEVTTHCVPSVSTPPPIDGGASLSTGPSPPPPGDTRGKARPLSPLVLDATRLWLRRRLGGLTQNVHEAWFTRNTRLIGQCGSTQDAWTTPVITQNAPIHQPAWFSQNARSCFSHAQSLSVFYSRPISQPAWFSHTPDPLSQRVLLTPDLSASGSLTRPISRGFIHNARSLMVLFTTHDLSASVVLLTTPDLSASVVLLTTPDFLSRRGTKALSVHLLNPAEGSNKRNTARLQIKRFPNGEMYITRAQCMRHQSPEDEASHLRSSYLVPASNFGHRKLGPTGAINSPTQSLDS